jgi:hypothetical protein
MPRGSSVLVLTRGMMTSWNHEKGDPAEISGDPATAGPTYWHFSAWPMALKGGYCPYLFDQGIPLVPRKKLKAPDWTSVDKFDLRQAPEFEYYLVRNPLPSMSYEPALQLVGRYGDWALWKRIGPTTEEP